MIWRWLVPSYPEAVGSYLSRWNAVIADQHAAATARYLLGAAGPARVVGNRIVEERERRVAARIEAAVDAAAMSNAYDPYCQRPRVVAHQGRRR